MENTIQAKRNSKRKWLPIIITLLVAGGITFFVLEKTHVIDFDNARFDDGLKTNDIVINSGSNQQGGAVDQLGVGADTVPNTDQSQWTTSESGLIALQQPAKDALIQPGDAIIGTATTDLVQYRLEDDRMGVIAQGSLNVVNGIFSGIIQFQAYGAVGTLDIFTFDENSGAETNHADINVRFKN